MVAADGVSASAFDAYTGQFDSKNEIIKTVFAMARVASLNDSAAAEVGKNALVNSVTFNDWKDTGNDGLPPPSRKRRDTNSLLDTEFLNVTLSESHTLDRRVGPAIAQPQLNQVPPPTNLRKRNRKDGQAFLVHLEMLSQTWFDNSLLSYNGKEYVFEVDPGKDTYIYVLNDGVNYSHGEFADTSKDPQIVINN